jgi:hypothetical protein
VPVDGVGDVRHGKGRPVDDSRERKSRTLASGVYNLLTYHDVHTHTERERKREIRIDW